MSRSKNFLVYENLDTSFVNLGALLRYLQQRDFTGRIHVEMGDYEAEIHLRAGEKAQIRERDRTTGREAEGDAALQRLLVRAQDAGGQINVYAEGKSADEYFGDTAAHFAEDYMEEPHRELTDEGIDWPGLLRTSAEMIGAIERSALSLGANFGAAFRLSRQELADDFSFLDPNAGTFEYVNHEIELHANVNERAFVSGLCEALRRVVDKIATGQRTTTVRERVALELAVLVRRRGRQLAEFGFMPQLDRIAGTRVI